MDMNYGNLLQRRHDLFLKLLTILPSPAEFPAELLILSAGDQEGQWSYRHVKMPGETTYFIFRKAGFIEGLSQTWECVDRELQELMLARG